MHPHHLAVELTEQGPIPRQGAKIGLLVAYTRQGVHELYQKVGLRNGKRPCYGRFALVGQVSLPVTTGSGSLNRSMLQSFGLLRGSTTC